MINRNTYCWCFEMNDRTKCIKQLRRTCTRLYELAMNSYFFAIYCYVDIHQFQRISMNLYVYTNMYIDISYVFCTMHFYFLCIVWENRRKSIMVWSHKDMPKYSVTTCFYASLYFFEVSRFVWWQCKNDNVILVSSWIANNSILFKN